MSRRWVNIFVMALLCAIPLVSAGAEEKRKERTAIPGEEVDAKGNRSLTGIVDQIETRDEKNGIVVLRTSKDARVKFWVDGQSKLLRMTADPLEGGLKSPVLKGAPVRITFVDRRPNQEKQEQPDLRVCQTLQLIKPEK